MEDSQRDSAPSYWATCTNFARSQKGFLLFAEIIFCLAILLCFSASAPVYSSLSAGHMTVAVFFFAIYSLNLHTKIHCISWPWSDFFRSFVTGILYLIISIIVLDKKENCFTVAAGVLGLIVTCLLFYDASITFPLW
ncbi:proteolipid protein 2-like [Pteropus medius]|uniref:proteolipid protein 2-like n=1 Tax=Pteropus vampyrus TaxID=132908 RepID=UPI00196BAF98|nr:proteolipid protein 2-like [Pteropus giganteus]